jgi:putative membrane protein
MKTLKSILFFGLISFISYGQQKNELSDAEVAFVAVVANQIDIDYAQIALKKSEDKDIKDFAQRMAEDHKAIIEQAAALAQKLGVVPKANAVSQSLLDGAEKTKKELERASKKDFDKKYIDNEVAYHKAVIDAVKNLLIPETENAELKELLHAVLPALEVHLEHAEMVQNKMLSK